MTTPLAIMAAAGGGQRPPAFAPLLFWFAADGAENCRLWSDAAGTVPAIPGGTVARIAGDEGYAFEQTSTSRRPARSADGKGLVFTESAGSNMLAVSGSALPGALAALSAYTIMVAATFGASGAALHFEAAADDYTTLRWDGSSSIEAEFRLTVPAESRLCRTASLAANDRNVLVARLLSWSGNPALKLDTSGADDTSSYFGGAPAAYTAGRIGATGTASTPSDPSSMTLHEIAIYQAALSDSQVAELIAYTKDRWGLP